MAALLAATLGTAAGCGTGTPTASSPTPPPPRVTQIPEDFPLALGMAPDDQLAGLPDREPPGIPELTFCGAAPLQGVPETDLRNADNSGGEAFDTRDLRLYADATQAARVARLIEESVVACPRQETEAMATTVRQVRPSPLAGPPSLTFVERFEHDGQIGPDTNVYHVVVAGNALLVTKTYGTWPASELDAAIVRTSTALRHTVDAMAVFDGGERPSAPAAPQSVPADFPLTVGLADDGGDYTATSPSADGDGVGAVAVCGEDVWPPSASAGAIERLVATSRGPEFFEGRELIVHTDSEVAEAVLARVRAAQGCGRFDNQVWTAFGSDTGHDSLTLGLSWSDGLGSSVFQWTRVGSAVLLVATYGEGSIDSLPAKARGVTSTTRELARAMCAFTVAGC